MGVATRRVHTADEPAHARRGAVIESGAHLNRRDGALSAALTITGPSTGPLGDTRVRGRAAPQGRGAPPPASAEHPPACRGSRRADPARTAAGRHRPAVQQLGARPCAHRVAGACGSNPPIVCMGRHHQTQPPSHGRGGSPPPHPLTTRPVSTAPAVRPGTGGATPPGAIRYQVMHQPTPVTASALPSSYDAAGSAAARAAGGAVHRDGATSAAGRSRPGAAVTAAAVGVATTPPPS